MKSTFFAVFAASASLGVTACGGSEPEAKAPEVKVTGRSPEEESRCAFEGREDRDVQESSAPGSIVANVRRVYGYIGEGEDRRRILLCREVDTNFDGVKDVVRTYGDVGQRLTEQADSDYDGKMDTWIVFGASKPSQIKLDADGDGIIEETRFYVNGRVSRIQRDTNGDGRADVFEVYLDGRLDRMGIDANFDGQVDRWDRDEIRAREAAEKDAAEAAAEEEKARQEGATPPG